MKPIKATPVKTRRKFDETFKREAVQNWLSSAKSAAVIAQELGLHADIYPTNTLLPLCFNLDT